MHELGMCDALVKATLQRAAGRRVRRVRVRIGGHPVDPDVVDQNFKLAALGTVAEDADVEVIAEPYRVVCQGCHETTPVAGPTELVACPRCGSFDVELSGSETVVLESITVDEPRSSVVSSADPSGVPTAVADQRPVQEASEV